MDINKEKYLLELKTTLEGYAPVAQKSWDAIQSIIRFQTIKKGEALLRAGQTAKNIHFICKGAVRVFFTDNQGNVYNKKIFLEREFPASVASLLLGNASYLNIEALEDSIVININFTGYKKLIAENPDMKDFYIAYLERNWIIEKEQREISLVMEDATTRYLKLLEKHPEIERRIPQLHIASHLGITPTQLSRIRKKLQQHQHM